MGTSVYIPLHLGKFDMNRYDIILISNKGSLKQDPGQVKLRDGTGPKRVDTLQRFSKLTYYHGVIINIHLQTNIALKSFLTINYPA